MAEILYTVTKLLFPKIFYRPRPMFLKRIALTCSRPPLAWAALACILSFSCAHSGAEAEAGGSGSTGSTGGSGSTGGDGYTLSDLDGEWVGVLYPNSNVLDPFNFYFISDDEE